MKKLIAAALCLAVLVSLSACVPEKSAVSVAPDLSSHPEVGYDFTQLHNDTLSQFADEGQYSFITDMDLSGSNDDKMVYVKAVCYEGVDPDYLYWFASAVLRHVNDAASVQELSVTVSSSTDFGPFWDEFGIDLEIYTEAEAAKEDGTAIFSMPLKAGEESGLDPDIESYEKNWQKQMEINARNEQ